jgi:phosphinothricin acetyltransferase
MALTLTPITEEDGIPVIDIFNYYIENSFAAYAEQAVPYVFFDTFLQMFQAYPSVAVRDEDNTVIGFGFLRAHHPSDSFAQTAEITYFIDPQHTRKGFGTQMLNYLCAEAKNKKIDTILANISSLNPPSIAFHKKCGFIQCGRFRNIGRKNGKRFDVVWMQKII